MPQNIWVAKKYNKNTEPFLGFKLKGNKKFISQKGKKRLENNGKLGYVILLHIILESALSINEIN